MSNLVLIPKNAGVSEREAKEAILKLIDARVYALQQAMYSTASRIKRDLVRIEPSSGPSPDEITRAMEQIRTGVGEMAKILEALTARYDARTVQLRDIEHPDADDPFADPLPIQQAS